MTSNGTICIIDDDEAVRESLRILLFAAGYQTVQFESADAFLALEEVTELDAFLLDLRMPGTDGMELHEILNERESRVPVIFITGHGDIPLAVSAIQKGAFDFLTKPFEEGELLEKISAAVAEYRALQEELGQLVRLQSCFESLTPRERDVMLNIVGGLSNKKIANALNISPRTVEIHRARVMEKMEADSVATLVRKATLLDQATGEDTD
ncbi:MAG: response regulator [Xanthomonadales bacterium]|nr:response regulator transcription factor [Xanthomonadales bacterium]NIX11779.1 response regulator [Xanthomonadales bacterium]